LPQAIQHHLTATRHTGGQVREKRVQHLVQNTGTCVQNVGRIRVNNVDGDGLI
jgi:hypothetical protein